MDLRSATVWIIMFITNSKAVAKGLLVNVVSIPTWQAAAVRCLIARPPQRRSCSLGSLRMMMTSGHQSLLAGLDASRPRPKLRECLSSAPEEPGCYIMESGDGRKLYIGKSVKLSSRVPRYFSSTSSNATIDGSVLPGGNLSRRIAVMTTLVERRVSPLILKKCVVVFRHILKRVLSVFGGNPSAESAHRLLCSG